MLVKANDTDILVIPISVMPTFQVIGLQQPWIAFGQSRNMMWIAAHELHRSIVPKKGSGITCCHAFTGCYMVSALCGKGKKSARQTWEVCAEASDVFASLSQYPPTVNDNEVDVLKTFVVMMCDRSNTPTGVNNARLDMFARKQRPYEAVPLTRSALLQHVMRAVYQAGCVCSQSTLTVDLTKYGCRQIATECLNVTSFVSPAQHRVVADVRHIHHDRDTMWMRFLTSVQLLKITSHPVYC